VPVTRSLGRLLVVAVAAFALAGCYPLAQPSFRPGDSRDVLLTLALQGVEAESVVTGESACSDPQLLGNALHIIASMPPDEATYDIYVYLFRPRSWEGPVSPSVDACQAEYEAANPGATITRIDIPTYRVFGADWPEALHAAVRRGLEDASERGDH
jgi:hypothetical protein